MSIPRELMIVDAVFKNAVHPKQIKIYDPAVKKSVKQYKKETLEVFKSRIYDNSDDLFVSLMTLAKGVSHLIRRDPETKRVSIVNDLQEIIHYFQGALDDAEYYYITTTPPNITAVEALLNRGYGTATKEDVGGSVDDFTGLNIKIKL